MGFSFHGHKRDVDAEKHLRRMHTTTPFIESPLVGADSDNLVFSQRHEANSVELFFDLFFVANLATFTAYHSITDGNYLLGYIGFFGILWATWFQITLHDVRFARDSIYERVCKFVQFVAFVGLALVGSQFNPASGKGNNTNFRILCYVLVISRALLMIQHIVVLVFTMRAKYSKLYLPLGLMIGIYLVATGIFVGMTPAFSATSNNKYRLVYLVWYAVMILEALLIVGISCFWRMLSFKKTHLMERMSLLTIIVIGEGAIGVTKTVSRIMGKHGLDPEGCFLIMCIIGILVLIWALYFDNFPHGHYGTIRQQIWSLLHFPFQLAIVGVVEGAQQLALARYVMKNADKVTNQIADACEIKNLDGQLLTDALMKILNYYELDQKKETQKFYTDALKDIWKAGNETGICSSAKINTNNGAVWPDTILAVDFDISNGMYSSLGLKQPIDKVMAYSPLQVAVDGWWLVYMYFWSCFVAMIVCSIIFLFLIRRHKADAFDYTSIIFRTLVVGVGAAMLGLIGNSVNLFTAMSTPALLPIAVVLMFLICCVDKISSLWCNRKLKKSGEPFALERHEEHEGHGHGGEHAHGSVHETAHENGSSSDLDETAKTARWSSHPTLSEHHAHALASPPIPSPGSPPPQAVGPHGYAPVQNTVV